MKNKIKIENMIHENKQAVFVDSIVQMQNLEKQNKYIKLCKDKTPKYENEIQNRLN